MSKGISSRWYKNLEPQEREKLESLLGSSRQVFDALDQILYEMDREISEKARAPDFTSPSWSEFQAHMQGQLHALATVRRLLKS